MRRAIKTLLGIFGVLTCLVIWLSVAMDYTDHVAVGRYSYKGNGESSSLVLNPDHTFDQTRTIGSEEQRSKGTWRRSGEGGYSFSKEFLVVSGDEPEPDGTTFSEMHKALGLFVSLRLRQYHVLWYGKTDSVESLYGTYKGDEPGVDATLILNADHSFAQQIVRDGTVHRSSGVWKQDSDGTVRFSQEFLKTSGKPLSSDETASSIDPRPRGYSLQVEISMADHVREPVFRKHLFSR